MAGRVPRRAQHDHRAVAEHILVNGLRFNLALTLDPTLERLDVRTFRWLGARDSVPLPGADQDSCLRKRRELAGVIRVIVADADIFDLTRLDADLRKIIDHALFWCDIG